MTLIKRYVRWFVETYVRVARGQPTGKKRRSADHESEQQSPEVDDILAEIEAIEKQATNFILGGEMKMPSNVSLEAISPFQTVEFIQTAADGSIAADCSSGSCECSYGFIDNGNGCETMTVEQAATQAPTTQAPTTQASTTTETSFLEGPKLSLWFLIDQVNQILEDSRPGKPRTHIIEKWQKLGQKFQARFSMLAEDKKCAFQNSFDVYKITWLGPPCYVRLSRFLEE